MISIVLEQEGSLAGTAKTGLAAYGTYKLAKNPEVQKLATQVLERGKKALKVATEEK